MKVLVADSVSEEGIDILRRTLRWMLNRGLSRRN